ncbi:MAG: hypothetical protein ACI9J2_001038 [Saprospiraceae bacterium]|jgi:hypothetical protein
MLPMGTIVTACMFTGLIGVALQSKMPSVVAKSIGGLVLAAGLWNVLWYAMRHIGEFWGMAALASGALMVVTGFYLLDASRLPKLVMKLKPVVWVLLVLCAAKYAHTIASL